METQFLREKGTLEMQCASRVREAETKVAVLQVQFALVISDRPDTLGRDAQAP